MSDSSIGIQMIMPKKKTGTSPRSSPPPAAKDHDSDSTKLTVSAVERQAPPPPGMGKLVDKTA
jgi:hypothetical protein